MKLQFIWVGKTRRTAIRELVEEYLGRVERFARVEVIEVRDARDAEAQKSIEREGQQILAKISDAAFVVALEVAGKELDSRAFAEFFAGHQNRATSQLVFVIGGHLGLSEAVRRRADLRLSLSRMTLTHELARTFLVEQVYRAFAILHGLPYQK